MKNLVLARTASGDRHHYAKSGAKETLCHSRKVATIRSENDSEATCKACRAAAAKLPEPTTREEWLQEATTKLREVFAEQGHEVPEVSVSVGFPGGGSARSRIGECWVKEAASDGLPAIFVSPLLGTAPQVLETLTHELVHAMDLHGHGPAFRKVAVSVGLAGKMTATHAGEELAERLVSIAEELGEYGHGKLKLGGGPAKQSTRMLKAECPEGSGYKVRLTAKWLGEYGAPICPHCDLTMDY